MAAFDTVKEQKDTPEVRQEAQFPVTFLKRCKAKTVDHPFSQHDNRHAFQLNGVYFGQGLGKKLVLDERNQHKSDDIIGWSGDLTKKPSYMSTYNKNYECFRRSREKESSLSVSTQDKYVLRGVGMSGKERDSSSNLLRRYPRKYVPPKTSSHLTTSNSWYVHHNPGSAYHTPLSVLAATQQPFLPSNPWKYSFKHRKGVSRRAMNQTC